MCVFFLLSSSCHHRSLSVLTHAFPSRRSSDPLASWSPGGRKKRTAMREVHLHVTGRIESRVMMADDCVVFVVDDDERIREALGELLASHDMREIGRASCRERVCQYV